MCEPGHGIAGASPLRLCSPMQCRHKAAHTRAEKTQANTYTHDTSTYKEGLCQNAAVSCSPQHKIKPWQANGSDAACSCDCCSCHCCCKLAQPVGLLLPLPASATAAFAAAAAMADLEDLVLVVRSAAGDCCCGCVCACCSCGGTRPQLSELQPARFFVCCLASLVRCHLVRPCFDASAAAAATCTADRAHRCCCCCC